MDLIKTGDGLSAASSVAELALPEPPQPVAPFRIYP
jgi:hypothetical protein